MLTCEEGCLRSRAWKEPGVSMVCWRARGACVGVNEPWRNHGSEILRRALCGVAAAPLPLAAITAAWRLRLRRCTALPLPPFAALPLPPLRRQRHTPYARSRSYLTVDSSISQINRLTISYTCRSSNFGRPSKLFQQ